jgi:hypothetical protein
MRIINDKHDQKNSRALSESKPHYVEDSFGIHNRITLSMSNKRLHFLSSLRATGKLISSLSSALIKNNPSWCNHRVDREGSWEIRIGSKPSCSLSRHPSTVPPCLKSVAFHWNGRGYALFLRGLSPQPNAKAQSLLYESCDSDSSDSAEKRRQVAKLP